MANMPRPSSDTMENGMPERRSVPVPDPTKLTTDAVDRLEKLMREVIAESVARLRDNVMATLSEQDKAVVLLRTSTDKYPEIMKYMIATLQSLHEEKFNSIDNRLVSLQHLIETQFKERDIRTDKTEKDSKTAVDAALQAAEKNFNARTAEIGATIVELKGNFNKLIDGIDGKITILTKTFDDKLAILRDVLAALSNQQVGTSTGISAKEDSSKAMWVVIGIIGTLLVGGLPILIAFLNKGGP